MVLPVVFECGGDANETSLILMLCGDSQRLSGTGSAIQAAAHAVNGCRAASRCRCDHACQRGLFGSARRLRARIVFTRTSYSVRLVAAHWKTKHARLPESGGWVGLRPYFSSARGVDKKRRAVCFRKARCSGVGDTVRADLLGIRPALVWNCSACAGFAVELRVRFHLLVLAVVQVKVKAARCQE